MQPAGASEDDRDLLASHQFGAKVERIQRQGVARGELRADLDVDLAADAVFGSFFTRFYERGRPGPEWPGQVVDELYPGLDTRLT